MFDGNSFDDAVNLQNIYNFVWACSVFSINSSTYRNVGLFKRHGKFLVNFQ